MTRVFAAVRNRWGAAGCVAVAVVGSYFLGRARADVPATNPMTFSGIITNGGVAFSGDRDITLSVCDASTAGSCQCLTGPGLVAVDANGRFRVPLPPTCVSALAAVSEPYLEVRVSGVPLGRTKVGSVPFAQEAARAFDAAGALASAISTLQTNVNGLQANVAPLVAASFPASAFRAKRTTALDIPSLGADVVFNTVEFDLLNEYDEATGVFTPANDGLYLLTCGFMFSAAGAFVYSASLTRNGPLEIDAVDVQASTANGGIAAKVTTAAQLLAGDQVRCRAYHAIGSPQPLHFSFPERQAFSATRLQ
jgi:hypothetical protein